MGRPPNREVFVVTMRTEDAFLLYRRGAAARSIFGGRSEGGDRVLAEIDARCRGGKGGITGTPSHSDNRGHAAARAAPMSCQDYIGRMVRRAGGGTVCHWARKLRI